MTAGTAYPRALPAMTWWTGWMEKVATRGKQTQNMVGGTKEKRPNNYAAINNGFQVMGEEFTVPALELSERGRA